MIIFFGTCSCHIYKTTLFAFSRYSRFTIFPGFSAQCVFSLLDASVPAYLLWMRAYLLLYSGCERTCFFILDASVPASLFWMRAYLLLYSMPTSFVFVEVLFLSICLLIYIFISFFVYNFNIVCSVHYLELLSLILPTFLLMNCGFVAFIYQCFFHCSSFCKSM